MTENWLDQFDDREMSTPVPDIIQPKTAVNDENQDVYAPQFLVQQPGYYFHPQGVSAVDLLQQSLWGSNLGADQLSHSHSAAQGQQNQLWSDNTQQQQRTSGTGDVGSCRRALREKAMQGDANKYRARREGAVSSTSVESSSADNLGNWTSTSASSQASSTSYSPPQPTEKKKRNKKRKMRPCEKAEQEMNSKKRRLAPVDVTEADLHDGSDRMVKMTLTAYMKLISKVAEPKGMRTIGMVQPGAFKRLAQKGDMRDVWTECLLCGAQEANKTRMKAHYEAHLPTRNLMALLLGECEKIGQLALGSKTMASEESQQASYRMSHSLWKHYGTMLAGKD